MSTLLLSSWAYAIFQFLRRLGPFGIFFLSALDTSFLVMPFGNDFLLIALITSNKPGPIWIVYVVVCTLGSMLGALIDDLLARKAGEKGLRRFVDPNQIRKLTARIQKQAGWVIFTSTLLPPPFPFTAVIMTAAALQHPRKKLLLLVFVGRLLRFTLIGLLALHFGNSLLRYARTSPVFEYMLYVIIAIAVVGSTLTLLKWTKGQRKVKSKKEKGKRKKLKAKTEDEESPRTISRPNGNEKCDIETENADPPPFGRG